MHSLQKVHRTGTGRGPRAPTGTDSEDSFFTGAGHVYPHLDEAHVSKPCFLFAGLQDVAAYGRRKGRTCVE